MLTGHGITGDFSPGGAHFAKTEPMNNYEWAPWLACQYKESVARTTSPIPFRHLRKVSHMPDSTLNFASSYTQWNHSQAELKRQYLLVISMPYGSAFRHLSFSNNNNVSGNILDREEWLQTYLIPSEGIAQCHWGSIHYWSARPSSTLPHLFLGCDLWTFLPPLRASNSLTSLVESPR